MADLKEEFLVFFIEEVQDIIDRLEQTMLNFEQTIDEELSRSIKRDFHTLKGDFLTYNFKKYSDYFHKVEDLWEIEDLRPFTSEAILNNIKEIRELLKITQNKGLEEAKIFEEKSNMLVALIKEQENVIVVAPPEITTLKEVIKEKPPVGTEIKLVATEEKDDNNYTFTLTFTDDNNLKLEEIEQFFKFYGEIIYIKKVEGNTFKTLVSTVKLPELLSNLNGLIGQDSFKFEKGGELVKEIEYNKLSTNIAEIKEIKAIRVSTDNLNFLLNNISELIAKHSNLNIYKNDLSDKSRNYFEDLMYSIDKITKDIQDEIFNMRLVPARFLFSQLRRIIRDISKELGKDVWFEILGEDIQVDKEILDKLSAPLKHMLKNSLDHGLESAEERKKAGKSSKGLLRLDLYQKGEDIVIEIYDDGRGLELKKILRKAIEKGLASPDKKYSDDEIKNLIFTPGFSTSDYVSEISGRGVGMDVVRNNINELNGTIEIETESKAFTLFRLTLPTTLSVIDGFLISQGEKSYVIPIYSIFEIIASNSSDLEKHENFITHNNENYQLVLNPKDFLPLAYILIETAKKKFAIPLDEVVSRRQFIVKKLNIKNEKLEKYLGATILATGETALVINPKKLN